MLLIHHIRIKFPPDETKLIPYIPRENLALVETVGDAAIERTSKGNANLIFSFVQALKT